MSTLKKIKVTKHGEDTPVTSNYLSAPSFYIASEQMPEIKDWEVGGKYRIEIEVDMKRKEESEHSTSANMEIVGYKYIPKKNIDEMTDSEFEKYQGESLDKGALA